MLGDTIQFQGFDVGQGFSSFEAGYLRNCCACPDIQKDLIARENPRRPVLVLTSTVFGAAKRASPRINSAPLVFLTIQVQTDESVDHLPLARASPSLRS